MIDEAALKDTLLAFAIDNRSNYVMLVSLLNELAALRETVRVLDPTFAEVLEEKRNEAEKNVEEKSASVLAEYDRIIQKLKDGRVC